MTLVMRVIVNWLRRLSSNHKLLDQLGAATERPGSIVSRLTRQWSGTASSLRPL